jgi:pyruvate, water dikinase
LWIDLASAAALEVARVGAKAAGVARLLQAGLPVPDGWCLPVEAKPAAEVALTPDEGAWRRAVALVRARLASTPPSPELRAAVVRLCAAEPGLLAVRSSAIGEGGSLSGQLSTFLGAGGAEAVLSAIQACWLSGWSDSVLRSARARGLNIDQLQMGVLVQKMVIAQAAGSAHSRGGQVTIEGTWGLGRGLAEAEVIPDVWRSGGFRPGRKPLAVALDPRGGETWQCLSEEQATAPCLDEATANKLAGLITATEQVFGQPVEVEWAVDQRKQPWLLQAQPFHTRTAEPRQVWTDADGCVEGLPASGGQAIGRARIVRTPADLQDLGPSDVLVAERLRPGEMAGLVSLAGLVLEAGGTTSHAATLARERGIPAVFAARSATRVLPQGAEVLVDGDTGRVFFKLAEPRGPGENIRGPARRPPVPPKRRGGRG